MPLLRRLWEKIADLALEFGIDQHWCLVGNLLVQLHAYEHAGRLCSGRAC